MKYLVEVREVHVSTIEVDASTQAEAVERVANGEGEEILCEYSHTLDKDLWTVEEVH